MEYPQTSIRPGYEYTAEGLSNLANDRHINDLHLKSRFEDIFAKYSRDFEGVGDVVDLETGQVIEDNGHIKTMADEQDLGSKHRLAGSQPIASAMNGVEDNSNSEDSEDELAVGLGSRPTIPARKPQLTQLDIARAERMVDKVNQGLDFRSRLIASHSPPGQMLEADLERTPNLPNLKALEQLGKKISTDIEEFMKIWKHTNSDKQDTHVWSTPNIPMLSDNVHNRGLPQTPVSWEPTGTAGLYAPFPTSIWAQDHRAGRTDLQTHSPATLKIARAQRDARAGNSFSRDTLYSANTKRRLTRIQRPRRGWDFTENDDALIILLRESKKMPFSQIQAEYFPEHPQKAVQARYYNFLRDRSASPGTRSDAPNICSTAAFAKSSWIAKRSHIESVQDTESEPIMIRTKRPKISNEIDVEIFEKVIRVNDSPRGDGSPCRANAEDLRPHADFESDVDKNDDILESVKRQGVELSPKFPPEPTNEINAVPETTDDQETDENSSPPFEREDMTRDRTNCLPRKCVAGSKKAGSPEVIIRGSNRLILDKPFSCSACSRTFRQKDHLMRHNVALHTLERPFDCGRCGRKFAQLDHLHIHEQARGHLRSSAVANQDEPSGLPLSRAGSFECVSASPLIQSWSGKDSIESLVEETPGVGSGMKAFHEIDSGIDDGRADCDACSVTIKAEPSPSAPEFHDLVPQASPDDAIPSIEASIGTSRTLNFQRSLSKGEERTMQTQLTHPNYSRSTTSPDQLGAGSSHFLEPAARKGKAAERKARSNSKWKGKGKLQIRSISGGLAVRSAPMKKQPRKWDRGAKVKGRTSILDMEICPGNDSEDEITF